MEKRIKKRLKSQDSRHDSKPSLFLSGALATLQKANFSRTKNREILLEFLIEKHGPFSIEEIHRALKRQELDLVTIYRSMQAFEEALLVRRCDFGDGIARFEFQEEGGHHHHHVICKKCKKAENLEHCELPKLENRVKRLGYSKIQHSLEFFGICKDCSSRFA
jgi:Fur family ferric uptake transcriptional regulator